MTATTLSRPLAKRVANVQVNLVTPTVEPDVPANVIQAASDALDRGETHYADRPGIPELRALVAEQLNAKYGLSYKANDVTICCGSTEPRFSALQVLVPTEGLVIAPRHEDRILPTLQLIGADVAAGDNGTVLYLTPGEDVDEWLDKAEGNGWYIIWDISGTTAPDYHPAQRPALASRVITIDDVENNLPGWAIGWFAGSDKHTEIRAFKQAMTICASNVAQWAALEWLRSNA